MAKPSFKNVARVAAARPVSGAGASKNNFMKNRSLAYSAVAAFAALALSSAPASAQSILKTADNYSVLASQAITVAGAGFTVTNGNIGLFPAATTNITGFPPGTVSGTTLMGTAAAIIATGGANQQAQADLQVAATGLAAMPLTANYSNVDMANLGPLPPGVYKWNAAATLTGALVLDAQGKNNVSWVFQFGTGLTTAVNSSVTLINAGSNGGADDGIFWNAATGAIVIGDDNKVLGNYIAYTSISFTGSTSLLAGGGARFLALNASVTFAGPGAIDALGAPGGSDWTGGLTLSGSSVVPTKAPVTTTGPGPIISSPTSSSGTAGAAFVPYSITASGTPTSYSAVGLPPGLTLNTMTGSISGTPTTAGTYVVTISATNSSGTNSTTVTIVIAPPLGFSHIINFSARAMSGQGSDTLIVGFTVAGNGKNVLIRGIGPGLAAFGITNFLTNTTLTMYNSDGSTDQTDSGWQVDSAGVNDSAMIAATSVSVGAFALASGSMDSALVATVNAGAHTVGLVTTDSSPGIGLLEIYDTGGNPYARLTNVSARMEIINGDLIAGFVIGGSIPKTVLIRGVGPTLSAFGVTGVLADPQITVFSGGTKVATNSGWSAGSGAAAELGGVFSQVGAFPLANGSKDAALILTLQPGAYTVQVSSVSNGTGVALIEVYDTQ
jgi:hypothetical protein